MATTITLVTGTGSATYTVSTGARGPAGADGSSTWSALTGTANHIPFDTTPTAVPSTIGTLAWSETEGALEMAVEGGAIAMGKETFDYFTNLSGVAMVDGDIVSIVGATGNRTAVDLTDATDATSSANIIGMVTHGAANNGTVRVTKTGSVHSLNTNGLTEGGTVYVDPALPGKWTMSRPTSPNHVVSIGFVQVAHSVNGIVDVVPNHQCVTAADIVDASTTLATFAQGALADSSVQSSQLSTTGGASKVVQIRSDGKIHLPDVLLPNPLPTLSRSGSSFLTFKRSDIVANGGKADFGQLGTAEANMAWNMDFTLGTGNHRYWDSTIGAVWASCSSQPTWNSFSIQYAPPGLSGGSGDIWELAGYPYLFSAHSNNTHGACMFIGGNTARNDARGPTMSQYSRLVIVRGSSQADISGDDGGLKLEGQAPGGWGTGVNNIYLNSISNGEISTGTGKFTIGTNALVCASGGTRVGNSTTMTSTPGRPFEVAPPIALANQTSGDFYVDSNGTVYVGRLTTDSGGGSGKQIWQGRTGTAQITFDAGGSGTTPTATFATLLTSTSTTDASSSAGAIKTSGGISAAKGIYLGTILTGTEQASEPAAPAANGFVIYAIDNGGKTQLMVKFATGAAQQLAIQP